MKKFSYLAMLLVFFFICASAQEDKQASCPTISVTGPSSAFLLNEPMIFTASVSEATNTSRLTYKWTVSGGELVEGQGTLKIKVIAKEECPHVTATLEIIGLPKNCASLISETGTVSDCGSHPIKIDEYEAITFQKEKIRLDKIDLELLNKYYSNLYFIIYLTRKQTPLTVKPRVIRIKNYLARTRKVPKDRIVFLYDESDRYLTKIYLVPAGSQPPMP